MKRLLIVIPLVAIAIGLFLFLRPFSRPNSLPVPDPHPEKTDSPTARHEHPSPTSPPRAAPQGTGKIHLLVQSQGKGLAGAKVKVSAEDGPGKMEIETDSRGFQTLLQVPVGDYILQASAPRHVPFRVHATVSADQTTEVTLPLSPGSRLEGRVVDPLGRPVQGANLILMNPPKGIMGTQDLNRVSDGEGRFTFDGIPLADLDLHVHHPRFRQWLKRDLPFRSPDLVLQEEVVLQEGTRVSGRVLDERGAPIAKALVIANNGIPRGEDTDAEGRFVIHGMAETALTITVKARGFGTHIRQGVPPNGEPLDICLRKAGSLAGALEASPPPEVFQVLLYRLDPAQGREVRVEARGFSGNQGAFQLPDLEPGPYRLEVLAEGYETLDQPQVLVQEGGANPPVRIKMTRKK